MATGDITKVPTAGIQFDFMVESMSGTTTTMYVGTAHGRVLSLTTSGVLAELTTKVKLPNKIAQVLYTSAALCIITDKGDVYTCGTTGGSLTKIASLNMGVKKAYYYNGYVYVILDGMQQEKSSLLRITL